MQVLSPDGTDAKGNPLRLGDTIKVGITQVTTGTDKDSILYLDQIGLTNLNPENTPSNDDKDKFLLFRLKVGSANAANWSILLGSPPVSLFRDGIRKFSLSVGPASGPPVPTKLTGDQAVTFIVFPRWKALIFTLILIVSLCTLYGMNDDGLLRSGPTPPVGKAPYSMAKVQMMWWFILVVGSFLFIWIFTDQEVAVSDTALTLIGISTFTAVGAKLIDKSDPSSSSGTTTPAPAPPPTSTVTTNAVAVALNMPMSAQPVVATASKGWLYDILNDGTGISVPRFQMFVWTFALGIIFLVDVYRNLVMPDLPDSLLGLMGISSGTYLGFKITE